MATMFKKPRRNFRRKITTSDSEDENDGEKEEGHVKDTLNNGNNDAKVKEKAHKKRDVSNLLSFVDAEEGDAEIFQVKKSSHSKRIAKQLKKESLKEKEERKKTEEEQPAAPKTAPATPPVEAPPVVNTEEKLRRLREELCTLNGDDALINEEPESDEETPKDRKMLRAVLKKGEIPDATMIHMIRKKRQMAREMGDFIPLDEAGAKAENSNSRLVRDDDHDKSDDDDDEEGRIDFAVNREARERQKMKDEFLAAEHGSDQEGSDLESGWEEQQIRKAVNLQQVSRDDDQPTQYALPPAEKGDANYKADQASYINQAVKSNFQPFSLTSKGSNELTLELIQKKLKERLDSIMEVHRSHVSEHDTLLLHLEDSNKEIEEAEKSSSVLEERFKFFQETRGYVRDLVECLNEKVPLILELEARMAYLLKQRAEKLTLRRQQDVRDQCQDYTASKVKVVFDAAEAMQRRVAEREARRSRRRRARESRDLSGHHEGLSSDDEENQSDITKFNSEKMEILQLTEKLFDDVEEDFCDLNNIKRLFEEWKTKNAESYQEAYIGLCLPKLFNPFVRLELIDWNLLEENAKDFEDCRWYECCAMYSYQDESISQDEDSIKFIPSIVEKVILPKLTVIAVDVWDPLSTSQTSRFVNLVQRLCQDYPTVHGESKNTQALLQAVVERMKKTLDDDVFMPLYLKSILENRSSGPAVFFHRQSWSCIKLLGNILSWYRVLATKMLHSLALEGLLNRYILLGLQTSPLNAEVLQKCSAIVSTFPKQWFVDLEEDKTIPLLENFSRFLMTAAESFWKKRDVSKESDKEIREHIGLICKLLMNIHAYNHASKLSDLYGLK
ncbi:PAX3- and PAX7-binding protein 1 [Octopus vulgaris]|uniref:PAX3- and PAX7-binding protein 1 n=1 Tax=Octopus vulgaris TaxID=6645 RepID=A0AA36BRI2_OCTVU|nr:PAX3- and PAX7-binding protein 1 [Octopus vulgaris]